MSLNEYTRRRFFEISYILGMVPVVYFALKPLSSFGRTITERSALLNNLLNVDVSDLERIKKLLENKKAIIWVFTGDSITAGVEHTNGSRSYPEIFEERIRWEMGRSRDIVINTGISGNTSQNIIDDFDWRIEQFKPAIVSLMIGTNDCSKKDINMHVFERNLNILLVKIRSLGAIPILQTPNAIITKNSPERAALFKYVGIIQNLAKKKKTILVDNYTYWKYTLKNHPEINVFKEWLNDPLHPNGAGHKEIARLMFKELSIFNSNDATCGGEHYEGKH